LSARRVCITGIGLVSPLGIGRETTWDALLRGENGAGSVKAFDARGWPTNFSCEVKDFKLNDSIPLGENRKYLNRATEFGAQAAFEAVSDSQILTNVDPSAMGITLGVGVGAVQPEELATLINSDQIYRQLSKSDRGSETMHILQNHPGTFATVLASMWNLYGPISTIQTACASSGQALGLAYKQIKRGELTACLSGGADSLAGELLFSGFCLIGALSRRNDQPKAASRPFDSERDGFVAGEGAAVLVLEELEHAKQRGAFIYGEIVGYGETESAYRITDLPPDGRGIVEAMENAISESELELSDFGYVNAHGTSTEVNDRVEALALGRVFSQKGVSPVVNSTKAQTGHLISAAGAIEASFCALALRDKIIPPTINLEHADGCEHLNLGDSVKTTLQGSAVMSNSVGFGGSNSSLVMRQCD